MGAPLTLVGQPETYVLKVTFETASFKGAQRVQEAVIDAVQDEDVIFAIDLQLQKEPP